MDRRQENALVNAVRSAQPETSLVVSRTRAKKMNMMRTQRSPSCRANRGFTLIELMLVTVIIGLLVVVAVPTYIAYRDKTRAAAGLGIGNSIQAALSSYTTTSPSNLYPAMAEITNYQDLMSVVNAHGGALKNTESETGIAFRQYGTIDLDGDGERDSYTMSFQLIGVSTSVAGWCIVVQPSRVEKCPAL
jgi:prepilin-type N-terminal cleavage/methylation domain-containing protein